MKRAAKIFTVILQVLIFFTTAVTLVCGLVKFCLMDMDQYYYAIIADPFDRVIQEATKGAFQTNQSIVAFPPEELYESLDKNILLTDAHRYTKSVLRSLFTGESIITINSPHRELEQTISRQFEKFEQESGMTVSAADKEKVMRLFVDNVNAQVNYIPKVLADRIPGIGRSVDRWIGILSPLFWPALLFTVCFSAILFVLNRKDRLRAFYKGALAWWYAAAALFVPAMVIASYNVPERLRMGSSGTTSFISGILKNAVSSVRFWMAIWFAAFTVLFLTAVIRYCLAHRRHRSM